MGHDRAIEIQEGGEMETASRGIYVLFSGLLPDTGGIEGTDYIEYQSVNQAIGSRGGVLPTMSARVNGKQNIHSYSYLLSLIKATDDGTLFIHAVRGPNVLSHGPHVTKRGYVIAFSPFIYAAKGGKSEIKKYKMPLG
jgi:hypothetical protein